jgi:LEA14-like dessication related protein
VASHGDEAERIKKTHRLLRLPEVSALNFSRVFRISLTAITVTAGGCAFNNVMTHPEADVQTVKIVQSSPEEMRLVAVLVFHNPNPLTLQLNKIEYHLKVDHVTLAQGALETLPLIRNHQDQAIEIPLVLKTAAVLAALPPADKKGEHPYLFTGRAYAHNSWAASPVMFEGEGSVAFPLIPVTHWAGLNVSRRGQKPEFGLEITNPNVFPIAIHRLQGQGEFENVPYSWEFHPKDLNVAPQQTKRIFVPCLNTEPNSTPAAVEKLASGGALTYWIQGELECTSPQGIIMVVIHEKGAAGKKN